ncbi:MAG: class I SAM-dependent methyltransferase [Chloroflexi bacterium]|nr:MAG: class I SAM-dependent methyltransferase [Chloroflexota bacterium]MBL1193375.1 class I SAM-dependent methyltransferase [Chloroflexota bacterium]NOH10667.1 methyltransferase [Chloroflexota bacterium]
MDYSFIRYLEAKRSVDDRALNKDVWRALKTEIDQRHTDAPLRVLELGAGIGTMLERMLDWDLFDEVHYTLLDQDEHNIARAKERLKAQNLTLDYFQADVFAFLEDNPNNTWDLIVAHAFLDLLDVSKLLPQLVEHIADIGLCYFTINYDGETIFEPVIEPDLDAHILHLYNRSMDERIIDGDLSGDSRAGRHLFGQLQSAGLHILEAGSSDWVVFPTDGKYPHDEAYFLMHVLHFFEDSLTDHPELDAKAFKGWLAQRRQQVARGELIYIAHQLDFLATLNSA